MANGLWDPVLSLSASVRSSLRLPPFLAPSGRSLMAFQFSKFKDESERPKGKSVAVVCPSAMEGGSVARTRATSYTTTCSLWQ